MKSVLVSVPGKIMLAGEYSVLSQGQALAATISGRLRVNVIRDVGSTATTVYSNIWKKPQTVSHADTPNDPLLEAVAFGMKAFDFCGGRVEVDSCLPVSYGVGTSSAVRIATLLGLARFAGKTIDPWQVIRDALSLQRKHQGHASGYDMATQYLGGVISFRSLNTESQSWPGCFKDLGQEALARLGSSVIAMVGGKGAPTGQILGKTKGWLAECGRIEELSRLSSRLIHTWEKFLATQRTSRLELFQDIANHRKVFVGSPAYPENLFRHLESISGCDKSWTFKATGAGGEDAILLVGEPSLLSEPISLFKKMGWHKMPFDFSSQGTCIEEVQYER